MDCLGIFFRPGLDDIIWQEHGVETIGNFTGYAMYLTHETKEAIDDAKELYSIDELISNLTKDEIIHIREGYIRVSVNAHKVTGDELAALDQDAYNLGYALKIFHSGTMHNRSQSAAIQKSKPSEKAMNAALMHA